MALPDRGKSLSSTGLCRDVDESRLEIHDCPLLSRELSVKVRPVWISQEESGVCICRPDFLWPKPSLVNAPDGVAIDPDVGAWIDTADRVFFLSLVRELARECAAE